MNIVIGVVIVGVTCYFLWRQYDMKMVLLASGMLMAGIALDPLTTLDEFANKMATDSLVQAVCSAVGFGFVIQETGCMRHLEAFACRRLKSLGLAVIPAVTVASFAFNSVLLSAANTAAAVGIVVIPLLVGAGVHPALAAAALAAGTFGSLLNPGLHNNSFVAKIAGVTPQVVVQTQALAVLLSIAVAALCLSVLAWRSKEYRDYAPDVSADPADAAAAAAAGATDVAPAAVPPLKRANPVFALIPFVPMVMLVLGAGDLVPSLQLGVAQSMLVGTLLAIVVTGTSPARIVQRFFDGLGAAYGHAMGLIISVAVFVQGMKSIGLVTFFITWSAATPKIAQIAGLLGPFVMGVMVGSGDSAAFVFCEAVAPHAHLYGMETIDMGSMAAVAGALGRTMSPFSAVVIVCSAIAKVNPLELAKRNALGMAAALATAFFAI
ncbi:C4-dicarboxylate transporter DcuC [Desulfocurvus sp. DL9XJH121]